MEPEIPGNAIVAFGVSRQLGTDEWKDRTCGELRTLLRRDPDADDARLFRAYAEPEAIRKYPRTYPEPVDDSTTLDVEFAPPHATGAARPRMLAVEMRLEDGLWKVCGVRESETSTDRSASPEGRRFLVAG